MDSRALDINARYLGVPTLVLMENAGTRIAEECNGYENVCVFAGRGGNGGDGYVAARLIHKQGKPVIVYGLKGKRSPECQKNYERLRSLDIEFHEIGDASECRPLKGQIIDFDVIVDALLGVGVTGSVREPVKTLINVINSYSCPKISVDTPTGDAETKVDADIVLALHNEKVNGSKIVDIGIPSEAEKYCGPGDVYLALPKRKADAHKGNHGRVLVVGGSKKYVGAPFLAGKAALRAGADLVTVCTPKNVWERVKMDPDLIASPLSSLDYVSPDDVESILENMFDCLVLGCGLGREVETGNAVLELLEKVSVPVVVDADALGLIEVGKLPSNVVLTPHAREYEGLFGVIDTGEIEKSVLNAALKTGSVILLKGREDVVSDGETVRLNKSGNPAMTVGGTGDVLAGVVGGLTAQNKDVFISACAGAYLTGLAGEFAYEKYDVSLTASDVTDYLGAAIKEAKKYF